MSVTPAGIVMLSRAVQSSNAVMPMLVTLSGRLTDFSEVQLRNDEAPILVTLFGICTLVIA